MKTFNVEFTQTLTVNAETEDEAIEKAKIKMDQTSFCVYSEEIEHCPEYDDKKLYRVEAISTQKYRIYIKAKNEDEAMELAEQADGEEFTEIVNYDGWKILAPKLVGDPKKAIDNKYRFELLYDAIRRQKKEKNCYSIYMNGAWFNTDGNGRIDMITSNGTVLTNDIEEIDRLLNESGLELVFENENPIIKDITNRKEL